MVSLDQFIVWVIIGLLGGSLAGLIVMRERKGFGVLRNLALGLVGALVGGFLFRLLRLFPELDKVTISLRDVVAAVVGSLLVLAASLARAALSSFALRERRVVAVGAMPSRRTVAGQGCPQVIAFDIKPWGRRCRNSSCETYLETWSKP
jgi:uncharacterized membrane protein YeaQ/YmgE (transglycosylase-associated protein family)